MSSSTLNYATSVADGGISWRRKAIQRTLERAQQEGKPLEEIVKERWGSMEAFNKERDSVMNYKVERRHQNFERHNHIERTGIESSTRGDRNHSKKESQQMRLPKVSKDLSWRKKEEKAEEEKEKNSSPRKSSNQQTTIGSPARTVPIELTEKVSSSLLSVPNSSIEESFSKIQEETSPAMTKAVSNVSVPLIEENQIAAQMVKAELMEDMETYRRLEAQLEEMRKKKIVVVSGLDERGRPIAMTPRQKYFERNAENQDEDQDRQRSSYTRLEKNLKWKPTTVATEYDDVMSSFSVTSGSSDTGRKRKRSRMTPQERELSAQRQRAIQIENRQQKLLAECRFCFGENSKIDRDSILSIGNLTYLMLPRRGSLAFGHCMIVPMEHVSAMNMADESIWEEISLFRKYLVKMFQVQKKEIIFFESAMNLKKQRHGFIECVPLDLKEGQQARLYFKKALMESESEWSDHKKIIDTTGRGVKRSIPEGFPYFNVEFGIDGGYAHVIEDERKFPHYFGRVSIQ